MSKEKIEHALKNIEQIIEDFVLDFEMIGLILIDRKGRIITQRNISDLFDTARLAKMVVSLYPDVPAIENYYRINNFSWLIFQSETQSLLLHPVGERVVLGMMVGNEVSLAFYKQQVMDLAYRLGINFNNLYQALKEEG